MKVVLRSSSLVFTVLSIILHVPISRVKRSSPSPPSEPYNGDETRSNFRGRQHQAAKTTYKLFPPSTG